MSFATDIESFSPSVPTTNNSAMTCPRPTNIGPSFETTPVTWLFNDDQPSVEEHIHTIINGQPITRSVRHAHPETRPTLASPTTALTTSCRTSEWSEMMESLTAKSDIDELMRQAHTGWRDCPQPFSSTKEYPLAEETSSYVETETYEQLKHKWAILKYELDAVKSKIEARPEFHRDGFWAAERMTVTRTTLSPIVTERTLEIFPPSTRQTHAATNGILDVTVRGEEEDKVKSVSTTLESDKSTLSVMKEKNDSRDFQEKGMEKGNDKKLMVNGIVAKAKAGVDGGFLSGSFGAVEEWMMKLVRRFLKP